MDLFTNTQLQKKGLPGVGMPAGMRLGLTTLMVLAGTYIMAIFSAQAQTIPRNDLPRFTVEGYDAEYNDGMLTVVFGVSMSDCIETVEVESTTKNKVKKYTAKPTLDHYYVRDNDMEEIYAKVPIGRFKKLVDKREGIDAIVTITSKSGRVVYKGPASLRLQDEEEEDSKGTALADSRKKH